MGDRPAIIDSLAQNTEQKVGGVHVQAATIESFSSIENLERAGSTDQFILTLPDNTLIANITPINIDYDEWQIVESLIAPDVSDPNWKNSSLDTQLLLPSQEFHTYSLFIKLASVVYQVGAEQTVKFKDTIDPVFPPSPLSLSVGTSPATSFIFTGTDAVDTGSGVDHYDTIAVDENNITTIIPDSGLSGEFTGLFPEMLYTVVQRAYDEAGNSSDTPLQSITTAAADAAGIVAFTSASYTFDESNYTGNAVPTRTSGTAGAMNITVSTQDRVDGYIGGLVTEFNTSTDIAISTDILTLPGHLFSTRDPVTYSKAGGTDDVQLTDAVTYYIHKIDPNNVYLYDTEVNANAGTGTGRVNFTSTGTETHLLFDGLDVGYEKLVNSPVGSPDTWADGVGGPVNLPIRMVKQAGEFNNVFDIQIDNTAASPDIGIRGAIEAATILVNSSATGVVGFQQESISGNNLVVINAANFQQSNPDAADPSYKYVVSSANRASTPGNQLIQPTQAAGERGDDSTLDADSQNVQFNINFTSNALVHVHLRMYAQGSAKRRVHCTYNNSPHVDLLGHDVDTASGGGFWYWTDTNDAGERRTFTPAIGSQQFGLNAQDYQSQVDKIVLTTNPNYDPNDPTTGRFNTNDDYYGPPESVYSSSTAPVNNPDNPNTPFSPLPDETTTAVLLSPVNGSTDIGLSGGVQAVFLPGTNGVVVQTFSVKAGGNEVEGEITIEDETVSWDALLDNSNTYTMTGTGYGFDINGNKRSLDFGPWSFTTRSGSTGGNIIELVKFSDIVVPNKRLMTAEDLTATFNPQINAPLDGSSGARIYLSPDPLNTGRGTVLNYEIDANSGGNYSHFRRWDDSKSDNKIYMALEICFLNTDFRSGGVLHMFSLGLLSSLDHTPHEGFSASNPEGQLDNRAMCSFNVWGPTAYGQIESPTGVMGLYCYEDGKARAYVPNSEDITGRITPRTYAGPGQIPLALRKYVTYELMVDMNSFVGGAGQSDGEFGMWHNGIKVIEKTNVRFMKTESGVSWNTLNHALSNGGGFKAATFADIYMGDITQSKTPITH